MNNLDFIVFDTETGGLKAGHHEVLQIAGKAYNARSLEPYPADQGGEFMSYMKPLHFDRLDPGALKVNRITVEQLEAVPDQKTVWLQFISWVKQFNPKGTKWTAPIAVAKNLPFDMGFVAALNETHCKKPPVIFNEKWKLDLDDFMFAWFENESEPENYKMDTLRPWFGMSSDGAHDAMVDVKQTGDLVMKFLNLHRRLQKMNGVSGDKLIKFKGSCEREDGGMSGECGGQVHPKDITVVPKGWGYERWVVNREYCGKELFFFSGKRCSFHYHRLKDETFLVLSGQFEIRRFHPYWHGPPRVWKSPWWENDGLSESIYREWHLHSIVGVLNPGDVFHVPVGLVHQMKAIGGDSRLIEFSTHHEDSDSYRLLPGD